MTALRIFGSDEPSHLWRVSTSRQVQARPPYQYLITLRFRRRYGNVNCAFARKHFLKAAATGTPTKPSCEPKLGPRSHSSTALRIAATLLWRGQARLPIALDSKASRPNSRRPVAARVLFGADCWTLKHLTCPPPFAIPSGAAGVATLQHGHCVGQAEGNGAVGSDHSFFLLEVQAAISRCALKRSSGTWGKPLTLQSI